MGRAFACRWRKWGNFSERGIYFLLDAIQTLGAFPLDVQEACVDFMAADAHKWMLGHEGVGIFYVRRELLPVLEPVLLGWNSVKYPHQFDTIHFELAPDARRFEEGSANGLSIYGMGAALELLLQIGVPKIAARILKLSDLLIQGLQALGCKITCPLERPFRSGIVTFKLPDEDRQKLDDLEKFLLDEKVYASIRRDCLRFSPHFYNSEEEMKDVVNLVEKFLRETLSRKSSWEKNCGGNAEALG